MVRKINMESGDLKMNLLLLVDVLSTAPLLGYDTPKGEFLRQVNHWQSVRSYCYNYQVRHIFVLFVFCVLEKHKLQAKSMKIMAIEKIETLFHS
jgi:hypothetical protein